MNNSRNNFKMMAGALAVFATLFFASCVDEPIERPVGSQTENIEALQASGTFDWKTSEKITVEIEGLAIDVDVNRKLTLETGSGDEFFGGAQAMNEDFEMTFDLPAHVTEVTMKYGTIEQKKEISKNQVSFSFVEERGEEDLEL
ncbi:hypothetical protein [Cyclobacterium jeungdonense]|uniref:Lipoprotein n=1 Tax=Cyclobacterium jeungdonense TaxID=708087 RepID=A0ABT8CDS4_9BACT|nr:hypothetical protein [Cyclobacterium jeungdonense]MDN3689698.1 hypothetical protein [Cyclobacterium jeungdonense]